MIKCNTSSNVLDILTKCLTYKNYQVSIFCDSKVKRDNIRDNIIQILKLAGVDFRVNVKEIVFIDSNSLIRFNPINESVRGQRHHEVILIDDINEEFIDLCIKPKIIPYRRREE